MNRINKRSSNPTSLIQILLSPVLIFTLFFSFTFSFSASAQMQTTQKSVYKRIDANVGGYLESLPNDYANNPTKKYPLLIFMHGVGERGNGAAGSVEKVANVGIPKLLKLKTFPANHTVGGKTYSFIVLSPQFQNSTNWINDIQAIIDYAKKTYRVDEQRIYLTGLSLGGIMGWVYGAGTVAHGQQLAAALLVCPGASATAAQLKNLGSSQLPIWVTNNSGDPYNPASQAKGLVNAINAAAPAPPKALLTIFNKSGHDAWTATYDPSFRQNGLNVYEWMLSKSRGSSQPQPAPATPVLTANAGANQVITLPANSVTLDASGSKVSAGSITSYTWTKVSGPSTGLLSSLLNGLQAKLTGLIAGVYKYQLTVKDNNGSTATATVTVTVNASTTSTAPPTVNAGTGGTVTLPVNTFTLDGSASKTSTGNTIVSYQWTKSTSSPTGGTITNPTSAKTTITGLVAGTYVYSLTVKDSKGQSKTGGTTIVVKPGATSTAPPTVNAGTGGTITLPANTFTLDGSASKASTGNTIKSYKWVKYSGPAAGGGIIASPASAKTTITGLVAGTYIYSLTVTDSRGQSKTGGTTIVVKPGSGSTTPPTAKVTQSLINLTLPSNTATLDGSPSVAASGNSIASYKWEKYTGPSYDGMKAPTSAKISVTGLVEGSYGFKLTVTDNNGRSSITDVAVIVSAVKNNTPPTAKVAQSVINLALPSNSATLDGSSSIAATGNAIASYKWHKYTGGDYDGIKTPNSAKITVTGLVAGSYGFTLTVTDNNGKSSSVDVAVIVKSAAKRTAGEDSATLSRSVSTDVSALQANDELGVTISPNPIVSDMNIVVKGNVKGNTSLIIYSIDGKPVQQQSFLKDGFGSLNKSFNLSRYPAGIYIVQVIVDGKYKKSIRVVKR